MITEYRIKGSLGIGTGMLFHLGGFVGTNLGMPRPAMFGVALVATAILTYGCVNYIRAKGYNPLLGLSAVFPPVGLVIACLLPDRMRDEPPTPTQQQAHQRQLDAAKAANAAAKKK